MAASERDLGAMGGLGFQPTAVHSLLTASAPKVKHRTPAPSGQAFGFRWAQGASARLWLGTRIGITEGTH